MVKVRKEGVLIESTELEFENQAVLNPSVVQIRDTLHIFYRAVREGNFSSIGYCRLKGPKKIMFRKKKPIIFPEFEYEKHGIEDPRVVKLGEIYYLFYTGYDGKNALICYAISKDLRNWEKKGIISPTITYDEAEDCFRASKVKEKYFFFESYFKDTVGPDVLLWEKDAFIFPKKFNNQFGLVHRIYPDIQIIYFNEFKNLTNDYWKNYLRHLGDHVILEPKYGFESRNIGAGAPVIETKRGWLMIYHSVEDTNKGKTYNASAALLDLNDPTKEIARLKEPLFYPTEDYEIFGDVDNVIFPSGTAIFGNRLYIYYGAADKRIAVASLNLEELLHELLATEVETGLGFLAGQIFNLALREEKTITQLMQLTNQNENIILMSVGWLVRENKVFARFEGNEIVVKIID
ncbi:MAG: winged helix-turn-helix domain-containing protein [Candidatus Lokiarchaeota archaeon]|nr:winged helix-turn-helix domain-containing protein [Candidatus Lokiarchaeota archaeon]